VYGGTTADLVAGDMWLVRSYVACASTVGGDWWKRSEDQLRSRNNSRRERGSFGSLSLDAIIIIAELDSIRLRFGKEGARLNWESPNLETFARRRNALGNVPDLALPRNN